MATPAPVAGPVLGGGSLAAPTSLWVTRPRGLLIASIALFAVPGATTVVLLAR